MLMRQFHYDPVFIDYKFNGENIISFWRRTKQNETKQNFDQWKSNYISKIKLGDIIWGAAGKGVMSLNMLDLNYKKVSFIVDKNPKLHGKYIPLTGNKIISPRDLKLLKKANIYVLNTIYLNEIVSECRELGVSSEILSLYNE